MTSSVRAHRLAVALCLLLVGSLPNLQAQEEKPTQPKAEKESTTTGKQRAYRGRLPNNWTKLNLTEEQKERIYKAQLASRDKLESLEKKLEELRQQSMVIRDEISGLREVLQKELHAVLTPEQLAKLAEVEKEAEKRRQERRAAAAKGKEASTDKSADE